MTQRQSGPRIPDNSIDDLSSVNDYQMRNDNRIDMSEG